MQGLSQEWASSYLCQLNTPQPAAELSDFTLMVKTAEAAWGIHDKQAKAEHELLKLAQWRTKTGTVSEYRSLFQKLAKVTGWNDAALRSTFYKGLKPEIKDGLLSMSKAPTFESLVANALDFETRLLERRAEKARSVLPYMRQNLVSPSARHDPNAMEIDAARLSPQEMQKHIQSGLCFSCHQHGHVSRNCPERKRGNSRPQVAGANVEKASLSEVDIEKEVERRVAAALKSKEQGFQISHN